MTREKLPDSIMVVWHAADIQVFHPDITRHEARRVLQFLEKNHDANVGINWDVISDAVDSIKEMRRPPSKRARKGDLKAVKDSRL